jgi:purine-binding chemotaxis protein CheW
VLLCRAGHFLVALPVDRVIETMRPLPVDRLGGPPPFVSGFSLVRGVPVPVVDVPALLGVAEAPPPGRFVTTDAGGRTIALAVSAVVGMRSLTPDQLGALPPLLAQLGSDVVSAVAVRDAQALLLLEVARILPDDFVLAGEGR